MVKIPRNNILKAEKLLYFKLIYLKNKLVLKNIVKITNLLDLNKLFKINIYWPGVRSEL